MVLFDCIMKVVSSFHWNAHCIQITHLPNLWNGWVWGLVIVSRPVIVGRYQARHKVSQSFKPVKLAVLDHFLTWVKTDFRRNGHLIGFLQQQRSFLSRPGSLASVTRQETENFWGGGGQWEHMTKPNITSLQSVFSYPVLPCPVWASPSVIGAERVQLAHMVWFTFHHIWNKQNPTWWWRCVTQHSDAADKRKWLL